MTIANQPNASFRKAIEYSLAGGYFENPNGALNETLVSAAKNATDKAKNIDDSQFILDSLLMPLTSTKAPKRGEMYASLNLQYIITFTKSILENITDINKPLGRIVSRQIMEKAKDQLSESHRLTLEFAFDYHNSKNKEELLIQPGNQEKLEQLKNFGLDDVEEYTHQYMEVINKRDAIRKELIGSKVRTILDAIKKLEADFNIDSPKSVKV